MIIIGCDFHPSYQQVAKLDTEAGRIEDHKLMHASGEAERFYRESWLHCLGGYRSSRQRSVVCPVAAETRP
jgi:hypothetical protein